jgi:arsenate reductase
MAEGFWRHYAGDRWEVFSAGISPMGVSPLAIAVMGEVGIDISTHRSQSTDEFVDQPFDLVVTVCSEADRNCPVFPGAKRKEHWPFDDPVGVEGNEQEVLEEFRRVRDEIGAKIRQRLGHT